MTRLLLIVLLLVVACDSSTAPARRPIQPPSKCRDCRIIDTTHHQPLKPR